MGYSDEIVSLYERNPGNSQIAMRQLYHLSGLRRREKWYILFNNAQTYF